MCLFIVCFPPPLFGIAASLVTVYDACVAAKGFAIGSASAIEGSLRDCG